MAASDEEEREAARPRLIVTGDVVVLTTAGDASLGVDFPRYSIVCLCVELAWFVCL